MGGAKCRLGALAQAGECPSVPAGPFPDGDHPAPGTRGPARLQPRVPRGLMPGDNARARMRWALSRATLCSGLCSGHPVRPAGRSGQHLGGHRAGHCAVLPASPHLRGSSPPQAPVLVLRLGPCQRWQAEPTGGGVSAPREGRFAPPALLGAARPPPLPPPCLLLSQCQCKGGISVQNQILQHLIPCTGVTAGGFGPAHPEVASWAGRGRSGRAAVRPSVRGMGTSPRSPPSSAKRP